MTTRIKVSLDGDIRVKHVKKGTNLEELTSFLETEYRQDQLIISKYRVESCAVVDGVVDLEAVLRLPPVNTDSQYDKSAGGRTIRIWLRIPEGIKVEEDVVHSISPPASVDLQSFYNTFRAASDAVQQQKSDSRTHIVTPPGSDDEDDLHSGARTPPDDSSGTWSVDLSSSIESSSFQNSALFGSSTPPVERLVIEPEPTPLVIHPEHGGAHYGLSSGRMDIDDFTMSPKPFKSGAFGRVWLGLLDTGEFIAIKELEVGDVGANADKITAVENEIALMEGLHHPHIVRYMGTRRKESSVYIFMEYVSGGSVHGLLRTMGGPLDERVVLKYSQQILMGLEYLHKQNILHRDIKSANVLVETTGNVKLADFGCSKVISDLMESAQGHVSLLGTPHWMAPEVIKQSGASFPSDIWSFGCTVIEMATGNPPWCHIKEVTAVLFHVASSENRPELPPSLSSNIRHLIYACLERDPSRRPTASQLLGDEYLNGVSVAPSRIPTQQEVRDSDEYVLSLVSTQSIRHVDHLMAMIPSNLLLFIFQFLSPANLASASLVCKHWSDACNSDALWSVKAKERWPGVYSSKGTSWKFIYELGESSNSKPWSASRKVTVDNMRGHMKAVNCLSVYGDRALTGSDDKRLRVWSIRKRKCLSTLKAPAPITGVHCGSKLALSCDSEGSIRVWDIAGKHTKPVSIIKEGHVMSCTGIHMTDDESVAASCSVDSTIRIWDLNKMEQVRTLAVTDAHGIGGCSDVKLDPSNFALCISVGLDHRGLIWDTRQDATTPVVKLMGHTEAVTSVQWKRSTVWEHLIATGSWDSTVRLWDLRKTCDAFCVLDASRQSILSVDFDDNYVVAGDKTLKVWEIATESCERGMRAHGDDITGVHVQSGTIVSCSKDKTVKLWSSKRPRQRSFFSKN